MKIRKNKDVVMKSKLDIEDKLKIIGNILKYLEEIFILLNPLIEKILSIEEAEKYRRNGTFKKVEDLFDNISNQSKELIDLQIPYEILKHLKN
ncbi:MAG: hypothetical protein ACFFG0_50810 [Candidatus Thorarchaeota archaeon]